MSVIKGSFQNVEVMNLTSSSQISFNNHQAVLFELEAKKIAATIDVPTLPHQVRSALRQMGMPVRLFGENLANVRDRLRIELARQKLEQSVTPQPDNKFDQEGTDLDFDGERHVEEDEVTKYTRALPSLIAARHQFTRFSLDRAAARLERERNLRGAAIARMKRSSSVISSDVDELENKPPAKESSLIDLDEIDKKCKKEYDVLRQVTLEGSQYGDSRALSCICHQKLNGSIPLVATGGWTGSIHLWDGNSPALSKVGEKTTCHEDRIMGIAMQTLDDDSSALIATTSIDLNAKLWKVAKEDLVIDEHHIAASEIQKQANNEPSSEYSINELSILKGHAARLCRVAFHPMKKHLATTSFDHSWRLWDIETSQTTISTKNYQQEILLQDGHCREVYGIGFHPDGSLCATTDFAGVVQVWDMRTGKSIRHFLGHARRVLNAEFHPINGFQLATAGDDGTIRVWDLRRRKQLASIPAHSNLITGLRFESDSGEYLASSSFDGTIKLWSTRDWKMLNQLHGHEGKVSGVDVLENNTIVTCGFDKTLKMWR